jgi:hypothetical protein
VTDKREREQERRSWEDIRRGARWWTAAGSHMPGPAAVVGGVSRSTFTMPESKGRAI